MIEHSMSAISDVPHGAGLSVIMPAWMQWYQSQRPAQFKRFAKEIFGLDKAEEGIQALKAWFDKIGTPTRLEQLGIDDETLAEIIENAAQTAIRAKVEKTYTKEAIEAIFALAKVISHKKERSNSKYNENLSTLFIFSTFHLLKSM